LFDGFIEGIALGLATGTACLATCGPIYGAYLLSEKRTGKQSFWVMLLLSIGRFVSYAVFGALAGLLGGSIPIPFRVVAVNGGYLLFSVFLLLSVVRIRKTCGGCQTSRLLNITKSPFLLGVLTGFSICPSFLIALTVAFESSGPIAGSMLFTGFFFGTTVYILPFALFGLLTHKKWLTTAARILAVGVAVYFAATGIRNLVRYYTDPQRQMLVDQHSNSEEYAFSALDQDTVYVLFFPELTDDYGDSLALHISDGSFPSVSVITADSENWLDSVERIPELSAVIASWWVDSRSGVERSIWQDEVSIALEERRMRIFAVEYEPYCSDRAESVRMWLETYSFKCDPDSGFSFLMLNSLSCDPADCSTCPIVE
jgi:sulfite exporter TauE/SafE